MLLVKVRRCSQITLPWLIRKKYHIDEGDYLELEEKDGTLVLKPVKIVHPEQAYFYSKEWQRDKEEADKDIAEGKMLGPFDTIEDFAQPLEKVD